LAEDRRTHRPGDYPAGVDILDYAAVTHPGMVKQVNEDSVLAESPVFVVADGISGCSRGELASGLLTHVFGGLAGRVEIAPELVADTLDEAHRRVIEAQRRDHHSAATTACGAVALRVGEAAYWLIFNVGDSRVYRITGRDRQLSQITVDHSHVQELLDAGVITAEQASRHPERNVITRAVGSRDGFQPDFWLVPMVSGDRLLLCSDGLLKEADLTEITRVLSTAGPAADTVNTLLELALQAGARDNVSIIVVDVRPGAAPEVDPQPTEILYPPSGN
jgi:serine/threonine protein phosphatase PrpC